MELAAALGRRGLGVAVVTRGEGSNALVDHGLAGVVAATPGDAVDVLSCVPRRDRRRHRSDPHRSPTGDADGHPVPDARCLLPGLGPYPSGGRISCDPACQVAEEVYAYNRRVNLSAIHPTPRACRRKAGCLDAIERRRVLKALGELC